MRPEGLSVEEEVISKDEETRLISVVLPLLEPMRGDGKAGRQRVRRFGWSLEKEAKWLGDAPMSLFPDALQARGIHRGRYESVTLNEYRTGQSISPHVDPPGFGEPIWVLSLGAGAVMSFTDMEGREVIKFPVGGRTLVGMRGEARWKWRHGAEMNGEGVRHSIVYRGRLDALVPGV